MSSSDLPKEVRDLVARHLHSMEEVEVLILLAERQQPLTIQEIRQHLRLPASEVPLTSLTRLADANLVASTTAADGEKTFRYAVTDPRIKSAVEMLRVAYNERPVTLVRLVYSRPSPVSTFADAFRLTKPSDE
jgi:predicted transcriptional regulator